MSARLTASDTWDTLSLVMKNTDTNFKTDNGRPL